MPLISPPDDAVSYYSAISQTFHASYERDANRLERVLLWKRFLDSHAIHAKTAYDIGCGSGLLACELAERSITTTGIDGAEGMLTIARSIAAKRKLTNLQFIQHILPIKDASHLSPVDMVVMSSAIEYLDSIKDTLLFVSKLLSTEGIFIFSISNRQSLSRKLVWLMHKLTGYPRYFGLIKHFMTVETIREALSQAGFVMVESAYFGRADKINHLLSWLLPERYASNMIMVAAQKKL